MVVTTAISLIFDYSNIVYTHISFEVTCLCDLRKWLRAFIIGLILWTATPLKISEKWRCIEWKIINFCCSTDHYGSSPYLQKTYAKILANLIILCSETTLHWPHFAADS